MKRREHPSGLRDKASIATVLCDPIANEIERMANDKAPTYIDALKIGAQAVSALALGALAVGALAIGALAIGRPCDWSIPNPTT